MQEDLESQKQLKTCSKDIKRSKAKLIALITIFFALLEALRRLVLP